jgi:hypothetical protein
MSLAPEKPTKITWWPQRDLPPSGPVPSPWTALPCGPSVEALEPVYRTRRTLLPAI